MKKSKKLILWSLLVVAGLLTGIPLLIGLVVQQAAPRVVADLDQQLGDLSIGLLSIKRHWFSSDLLLGVEPAKGAAKLIYHAHLKHGLWPLDEPSWLRAQGRLVHPDLGPVIEDEWRLSLTLAWSAQIQSRWHESHSGRQLDMNLGLSASPGLANDRT